MSELEDTISAVLNDPQQMEQITRLAQSLMGGEQGTPETASGAGDNMPLPGRLGDIGSLMAGSRSSGQTLLEAMRPYMTEKRRAKVDKALQLARAARIARLVLGQTEGGGGV